MQERINQLVIELMEKNPELTQSQALVWVELLWSDFESSYAKAGYDYKGAEVSEKIIRQWITSYGDRIHEFAGNNPKYAHLLNAEKDDNLK